MKPFDSTGAFISPTSSGELPRLAIRGAGVMVFAQGLAFAVQLIATMILARLLAPAEFGIVTMVTTFSVLLMSCGQVGLPDAVLQREKINHFLASNLFWINVGIGLILTVAFAATAPLLARFYGDYRVTPAVLGISLTILFNNTSALHTALLRRAMYFGTASSNDVIARFTAVLVTVAMGWRGFGYLALVAGAVAYPLVQTIGAFLCCRWIPSLPSRVPDTGSMVRFAAYVYGRWTIGYFTQNSDNLLVGWQFGSIAIGMYKKAYDLFVLPFNLLTVYPVAVSTLSRLNGDRKEYRRYLVGGLEVLAFVGMGVGIDLTLVGRDLIRLILGPQWETAGQVFTLFGPGVGGMLLYMTHGVIHLSLGTTSRYFRWGIIEFLVRIGLFVLTLPWGPKGIAVAWTLSTWVLLLPAFCYAGKPIKFGFGDLLRVLWKPLIGSLLGACICVVIIQTLPPLPVFHGAFFALVRISLTSLLFLGLYVGILILLHGGRAPLNQLAGLWAEAVRPSLRRSKGLQPAAETEPIAVHMPTAN